MRYPAKRLICSCIVLSHLPVWRKVWLRRAMQQRFARVGWPNHRQWSSVTLICD